MKYKRFRGYDNTTPYDLRYCVNSVDDLFNTRRFSLYDRFSRLLNTGKERYGKKIAKELFSEMMGMIADDLIYNNIVFVLPYKSFGWMVVTDVADSGRSYYNYNIETEGAKYGLAIRLTEETGTKCKKFYHGRFNRENRKKVDELVSKGHRY